MDRIMNQNSLDNLSKEKIKKEGYGYRYSIPQDKVDELFSHLANGTTLKKAAEKTNICFETARKYYNKGDPKRGIKPLQMRLEVFQEKISEKMNVLLEEQRMERIKTTRALIKKAEDTMLGTTDEDGNITEGSLGDISIRDYERLVKLEAFLSGGVRVTETETKILTADDISGTG
jgi:hypothetical protein